MHVVRAIFFCVVTLGISLAHADVGFFSPSGIPDVLVHQTQIGLFNAESPEQVERNLRKVDGTPFKVYVDLGYLLTTNAEVSTLKMKYLIGSSSVGTKTFAPEQDNRLRAFLPEPALHRALSPMLDVLAKYKANVDAVLLVDEPYLNGISKGQLERAGKLVRRELDVRGLADVKLGVIFASGMFDKEFAHLMDRQAGAYVTGIDSHFAKGDEGRPEAFAAWVLAIKQHRLVTYDRASNMYIDGGLPRGFDIFGFDYYMSTVLLDALHEHSMSWFAKHYPDNGCAQFAGKSMSDIRKRLSFFQSGSVLQSARYRVDDKKLLDAMYQCRMSAVTAMLQRASVGRQAKLLLLSESSNNGALEFNSAGVVEQGQPELLVESRVLDEVKRAEDFYKKYYCVYSAGLMYFTYQNAYDSSIKLHVGGASAMPSVMNSVIHFAHELPVSGSRKAREVCFASQR